MLERRWIRWVGPGVIALGALGSLATVTHGAAGSAWSPPPCGPASGGPLAAARADVPLALSDMGTEPWYRLDPQLDRDGGLQGQRLSIGTDGLPATHELVLPPESFAAGPFGRLVLVGADDGTTSRLGAIDVAAGCTFAITEEASVIRRATVDPAGRTVYEMLVDRQTRADLGIWARPLDGGGIAVRILEPIGTDERFGPTFTTEFGWEPGGDRLAVQSCGGTACRTRVIDPASGRSRTVDDPDLGALIAVDGDELVAYAACPGLPCPIVGVDIETGRRQTLADAAAGAVVVATPGGPRLVHEVLDQGPGVGLRSVALDGTVVGDLGRLPGGLRLQPVAVLAGAATRVPDGWILVAPDGRLPSSGPNNQTQLRHVPDGTTVQLEEAAR